MAVTLYHNYVIKWDDTSRSWTVPQAFFRVVHEFTFLQIRATCYGLCRLLGYTGGEKNCSMKSSPGLVSLLELRNKHLAGSSDGLFDNLPAKKRKRTPAPAAVVPGGEEVPISEAFCFLDLGDLGTLKVLKPKKINEDLWVQLEPEALQVFFSYLQAKGISFENSSRSYKRSGKYCKKGREAEEDQPEELSDN